MQPFLNLNLAISHPFKPLISRLFTSPSGISDGQTRSTAAFIVSVSKTNRSTFDFFVPRPSVRVCQAWCARIVKFVGTKAVVEGKGSLLLLLLLGLVLVGGKESTRRSSRGLARRIVNDFTMNWPPNRRPFTSEVGLKEKSEDGLVVWSFGCWCFCFLFLFFFSFFSMVCWWWGGFGGGGFSLYMITNQSKAFDGVQ